MGVSCPACGHENREGAHFCGHCAAPLVVDWTCAECGAVNPPDNRFCDGCGQPQDAEHQPPQPDPRSYTPDHLAEKILDVRSTLAGERKQVTVLFADVMGSMELAEHEDPEAWRQIMDRFFALLCEGVHRFEGTVVQFTGDGIMALFGAPIAHEDHALRAAYAALHLRETLAEYAGELRRERGLSFSVRVGLNSGEVVVGAIGDDLRVDYTAIGHTVGLAQRMESLAEPGKTYLTDHTAHLLEGFFELTDLGAFDVKGSTAPLRVYELAGIGAARSRLDLSRARGFSRFVGRAEELAVLETALRRAGEGNAQIIGVVGEPGVGKSRLCHEFAERARAQGVPVYHATGHAHAQNVPFLATLEMLRAYFGVAEQDEPRVARERIAGRLLLLDDAFGEELALVFEFLGVPDPERPVGQIDPDARQRRLLEVIRLLVHADTRREPVINLLEDLHWIDSASEVFLDALVDALPGSRALTIVNFRPEYRAEWMSRPWYQQLPMVPLGPAAIGELLGELLGDHPSLNGLHDEIRKRTAGNPFFIEELVQTLMEDGTLEGERGALQLAKPFESVSVPPSVHAVLAARIDRLSERDKALLQAAAVLGQEFGESVLERVAELSEPDLAAALRALVAAEFLFERALYPEAEYAFKHPLTREVAYGSQLGERRAALHADVARAIADIYPDRLDERAALLAYHWEAAGDPLEAARWHARAAVWAGVSAPAESLEHWERVRELSGASAPTPETTGLGVVARMWILQYGWRQGISEERAREVYDEGRELAQRAGDDASLALLMSTYAATVGLRGRMFEALDDAREAVRLAQASGSPAVEMVVTPVLLYVLFNTGCIREALAVAERVLELAGDDETLGAGIGLVSPYSWCVFSLGYLNGILGNLQESRLELERAGALALKHADVETQCWVPMNLVMWAHNSGVYAGAMAHARETVELAERSGSAFSRVLSQHFLGVAHYIERDWTAAVEAYDRSLTLAEESRTGKEIEPQTLGFRSLALLAAGDVEGARETAEHSLAVAHQNNLVSWLGWGHRALGSALRVAGELDAAEAELREGLAQAEHSGLLTELPFIHVELAEIAAAHGDAAAQEAELREAHRLVSAYGAVGHVEALAERLAAFTTSA